MRSVVHANCFPGACPQADALVTDEVLVANAAQPGLEVIAAEDGIDEELAHATSVAMSKAAFEWFRAGDDEDPSCVSGVSAGDLAGIEALLTVLVPAARGVLAMAAALDRGLQPASLVSVVPGGTGRYARQETLAADAAVAVARARSGRSLSVERRISHDPRNAWLLDKYARARDSDQLAATDGRRHVQRAIALGALNAQGRLRRRGRPALLVVEYNPSREFARQYGARRRRGWRLVRWPANPRDLVAVARAGDEAFVLGTPDLQKRPPSGVERRLRARADELNGTSLRVGDVDLWPIVRDPLLALVERHARYASALAGRLRNELQRRDVRAVLVPFDGPSYARLIVRVAQAMGIATFVINDGFKADDIQQEGMAADVALAWSEVIRDGYFSRRPDGAVVTGNPRAARLCGLKRQRREPPRVLVGAHAFSPVDLNCHRSDAERFLEQVLSGVAQAGDRVGREVVVKLNGADGRDYHDEGLAGHPELQLDVRIHGDVVELFERCDIYVSAYSTSLIEAAAAGLPIVYYRINAQRLGPPFSGDEFLARRTASTPDQLAALLTDHHTYADSPPAGWVERYLGPMGGSVDRILAAISSPPPARRNQLAGSVIGR
jgi:glycosyltransferase involved in cell wall biosynthesis